jgi:hypothetical protein
MSSPSPVPVPTPVQHVYILIRSSTQHRNNGFGSPMLAASEPTVLHVTPSRDLASRLLHLYEWDTTQFSNSYAVCLRRYIYSHVPSSRVEGCDITLATRFVDAPVTIVNFRIQEVEVLNEATARSTEVERMMSQGHS